MRPMKQLAFDLSSFVPTSDEVGALHTSRAPYRVPSAASLELPDDVGADLSSASGDEGLAMPLSPPYSATQDDASSDAAGCDLGLHRIRGVSMESDSDSDSDSDISM